MRLMRFQVLDSPKSAADADDYLLPEVHYDENGDRGRTIVGAGGPFQAGIDQHGVPHVPKRRGLPSMLNGGLLESARQMGRGPREARAPPSSTIVATNCASSVHLIFSLLIPYNCFRQGESTCSHGYG
jgi:hypothetical protein